VIYGVPKGRKKEKNMSIVYYNRHPKGLLVEDCVVRAVSTAFNAGYVETRRDLNRIKKALGFNSYKDHDFLYEYLKDYERLIFKAVRGQKRLKLDGFAKSYPKGTYIVAVRKHVVAVIDGVILDTWDSSYLTVYTAWKIEPATTLKDLDIDVARKIRCEL
jgi:hypothetical protein